MTTRGEEEQRLYAMKLHDIISLQSGHEVKRVHKGWIYSLKFRDIGPGRDGRLIVTSVFVPK